MDRPDRKEPNHKEKAYRERRIEMVEFQGEYRDIHNMLLNTHKKWASPLEVLSVLLVSRKDSIEDLLRLVKVINLQQQGDMMEQHENEQRAFEQRQQENEVPF